MSIVWWEWGAFIRKVAWNSGSYMWIADLEYIGKSGDTYFDWEIKIKISDYWHDGIKVNIIWDLPTKHDLYIEMSSKYQDFNFIGKTLIITGIGSKMKNEKEFHINISI